MSSPPPAQTAQPVPSAILTSLDEISSQRNDPIIAHVRAQNWHPITAVPQNVHDLGLGVPFLIPAEECWEGGVSPTEAELREACRREKVKEGRDVSIEHHSANAKTATVKNLLAQLDSPDRDSLLVGHNVMLQEVKQMCVPQRLSEMYNIPDGSDVDYEQSMNITPKFAVVDTHYDQGTSGISVNIGDCEKVWFLWPPTVHNLRLLEKHWHTHPNRLLSSSDALDKTITTIAPGNPVFGNIPLRRKTNPIPSRLPTPKRRKLTSSTKQQGFEHGIIAHLTSANAIFLPSGWLHTTLTLKSGFLYGITFTTAESISTLSRCFAQECRINPTGFENVGRVYVDGLKTALTLGGEKGLREAVQGWVGSSVAGAVEGNAPDTDEGVERALRRFTWSDANTPSSGKAKAVRKARVNLSTAIVTAWDEALRCRPLGYNDNLEVWKCGCRDAPAPGKTERDTWARHFRMHHLSFLPC